MTPLRRLSRDSLIAKMLREERALTAIEIIKEMRIAGSRPGEADDAGEAMGSANLARDAQLRQDMEIVRWVGGLRTEQDEP